VFSDRAKRNLDRKSFDLMESRIGDRGFASSERWSVKGNSLLHAILEHRQDFVIATAAHRSSAIAALAGLAMLRVLQTAFVASFRDHLTLGASACSLVTVADVPIFGIGAAFWGLVFGLLTTRVLEPAAPAAAVSAPTK
jgi:hypothetical protein